MLKRERGFSLVEIIIVVSLIGISTSVMAPKAIEAQKKSKSNSLRDEFNSINTLNASGKDIVHGIKLDMYDKHSVPIMRNVKVPVAPSATFGTIIRHEPFRRLANPVGGGNVNESRPLVMSYDTNEIRVYSPTSNRGSVRHTGNLYEAPSEFNGGVVKATVKASNLSSQGATGLSPLFSIHETKLHKDFVLSQSGLNFGEFESQFVGSSAEVLAGIFGGPAENITMSYYPYEPTDTTERYLVKAPIELTIVDTESIEEASVGDSVSVLTDASRGSLYQVTGMMSEADFVTYMGGKTAVYGTADVYKMYQILDEGFDIGELVYLPHRARDIIYSTKSDLKYGYYRD